MNKCARSPDFRAGSQEKRILGPRVVCAGLILGALTMTPFGALAAPNLNPFGIRDPLVGKIAPELAVSEWVNGKGFALKDLRGKVVVLEFFQLWCPGCNKFSIPLMKEWAKIFKDEKEIIFVSIHAVFEGHSVQSPRRLKQFLKDEKIQHLVGIDRHLKGDTIPVTMRRYRTGGTPAIAILDKKGRVRFKYFGAFRKEPVETFIWELINEDSQTFGNLH